MLTLTLKQVLAHKHRLLLTTFAVVLGVTFVAGTLVLTDTSRQLFDEKFRSQTPSTDVTIRTAVAFDSAMGVEVERDPVPADVLTRTTETRGVAAAAGVMSGHGLVVVDEEPVQAAGPSLLMSWADAPFGTFNLTTGTRPAHADDLVLDATTARAAGLALGDMVTLQADRVARLRLVGLAEPTADGAFSDNAVALVTLNRAQQLLAARDGFTEIRVTAADEVSATDLERGLADELGGRYAVTSSKDIAEASADVARDRLAFLQMAMLALAGAALLIGGYLIANTFAIVISQRAAELALLRAAGATPGQVFRQLLGEALVVGSVGSAVGTGLGVLTAQVLRGLLDAFGVALPAGSAVLRPTSLLLAFGIGLLVTMVAALGPARRAARVSPLQALRGSAAVRATSRIRIVIGVIAALLTASNLAPALLGVAGVGAVSSAAVTAIIALAALSPVLVGPLTRLVGRPARRLGVASHLATEFAARAPRRTAATVTALSLSLALITFMTVLGASLKDSIAVSYRETVTADLVIESSGGEMLGGLSPAVEDRVADLPEVAATARMRVGHWKSGEMVTALTAIDPATIGDVATIELIDGKLADLDGGGIAISEKAAERDQLTIGDELPMTFPLDGDRRLRVVGVFDDQLTQVLQTDYLVSLDTYRRHFAENVDATVFVDLASGADKEQARAAIDRALAGFPTAAVRDQDAAAQGRTAIVGQILGLVTVSLLLAVLIALLGITNTLVLSIRERTREIGLLRAVGMTDRQLRRMVRTEAVLLAILALLLGIALGVGFAAATVRALADGDAMQVVLPHGQLATVVAIAAGAGLLAGLAPARRAARLRLLGAISAT